MRVVRLASRPALLGALLGVAIGLCEAARLYFVPTPPLLVRNVRYVIWFVAPLVDMIVAGLVGLALGLLADGVRRCPRVFARLMAVVGGIIAVFWSVFVVVVIVSPVRAGRLDPSPAWYRFAIIFGFAILVLACAYRHFRRQLVIEDGLSLRAPSVALLATAGVLVTGLIVFENQHRFALASVKAGSRPENEPNIVLITIDTVRADHLSLYGYSRPTSPNLDRWAGRGVVFENAIASSPWTLPSHASILTGLLPHQHGADWFAPVDTGRWTLAEILEAQGYETAGFAANPYLERGFGMAQGFQVYDDIRAFASGNLEITWAGNRLLQPLYYHFIRPDRFDRIEASELNQDVLRWYRRRSGRPFFLFVNYLDVHEPHIAPAPYDQRFGQTSRNIIAKGDPLMVIEGGVHSVPQSQLSELERHSLVDGYDNCLAYLDIQVNILLTFLESQPDWSKTLVIITSDHGQALGEHGFYGHGNSVYRELLHVPLIVLGPGVPAGGRIGDTVTTRKLFATVLEMTLGNKRPFDDNSLARYWRPGFKPERDDETAISELAPRRSGDPSYVSLTTPEWQYIRDSKGHQELYDWKESPAEELNLALAHPEQVQELDAYLRERIASSLGPWVEPEYLAGLVPADSPPTDRTAFGLKFGLSHSALLHRVGVSQAYFPLQPSEYSYSSPRRERKPDEELLDSLPYH